MLKIIFFILCLLGYDKVQGLIEQPLWVIEEDEFFERLRKINESLSKIDKKNKELKEETDAIRFQLYGYYLLDN